MNYWKLITLGPLGPFLQSGVEVVSQLAQRRARRESPPPLPLGQPRVGLMGLPVEKEGKSKDGFVLELLFLV